ncbi:MAG: putative two-component sensor histidine kinase [Chloroflexi bacterium OLB14]|nr:MAG: putative two-component sensor histidine kinase [Chloroflexi bacterium OLB14]
MTLLLCYTQYMTETFDKVALLKIAFKGLDEDELIQMANLTRIATYPPDFILCHEGAYEEVFYIVAEGQAEITKQLNENELRLLRVASTGDLIGEMALIQNAPRSATVRTITDFTVLEMNKQDFGTMLTQSPRMAIDIIRTTLNRLRENDQMTINDLQKTNQVLRQLDRNKLEFIQVAAHELRTPLTVLKGYLNLLQSADELKNNESLSEVMKGILKGTDRMHEVVNMMLDVSRIDSETMKVLPTLIPLKMTLTELVNSLKKEIAERKIEVSIEQDENIVSIQADPSLMQKALYQLLVNAIKYTPDGGKIKINVQNTKLENDIPAIDIRFEDSGIGIDPEHQELIFEKFYQVGEVALHSSGKTAYKSGGSGLGLAIVRGIAKAHGGYVWVESKGHDEVNFLGSVFHLVLPVGL